MRPDAALRPSFPLRTERLLLAPVGPADADAMVAYCSQPDVVRYLPFGVLDRTAMLERISLRARSELTDAGQQLWLRVATLAAPERVVGDVMLMWQSREHAGGEIGYVLDPAANGHGYATEAANELLRLGFRELGLHRIVGRIDARNGASARVLERLGMRREAHFVANELLDGEWTDEVVYAMLADEFTG